MKKIQSVVKEIKELSDYEELKKWKDQIYYDMDEGNIKCMEKIVTDVTEISL